MLVTYAAESDKIIRSVSGTRERILLTAIRMFAEHGFHGVALRTINEQSGARNGSAVQYHFGNKFGLIKAVIEFIFTDMLQPAIQQLDSIESKQTSLTVRDIVEAGFGPLLAYSLKPGLGMQAARIMPLAVQDADPEVRQLFADQMGEFAEKLQRVLSPLLPEKPDQILRMQIGFAIINLIHLVTDLHVFYSAESTVTDPDVLVRVYDVLVDYIATGLASPRQGDGHFRDELMKMVA